VSDFVGVYKFPLYFVAEYKRGKPVRLIKGPFIEKGDALMYANFQFDDEDKWVIVETELGFDCMSERKR
jgi:hypothetical protein